ncbi:MAG: tRNA (adenosine(37)-N6)-dimethylallyltransferase MiaA [candidate division KSB1 bacterium]|nr:tRNA (adenosine(37)-N6)-dimethylallyltransferase MiaA [candidate division KSB1 bacterium]MDZ7368095.1 tRNA (adenosine(37)-N6)-dimethylallyltransferase MiaA [candidate division KSB1 bacterium]MDZ7405679.1 tRNA (adenosine(37)-N6)-dimethylallyltransferase MiaA [candidate division KSB1 bacterium]
MSSSTKPFAIILVGPTGVGKTAVSCELAKQLPEAAEIISADSRQVYKYMDIGTAKPSPQMRREIRHHFIDLHDPDRVYSAGEFGEEARKKIDEILARRNWPLVVGGSGLYLRALLEGFFAPKVSDHEIRAQLKRRAETEGSAKLHAELKVIDPDTAARLHPNDGHRIVRALEIYYASGKLPSEVRQQLNEPAEFVYRVIGLNMPRADLYARINQRVVKMLAEGLVDECKRLLEMGYSPALNALNTVGYQEVFQFLGGEISYNEMVELIKQHSRHYAKRQMTWFRKMNGVEWLDIRPQDPPEKIAALLLLYLNISQAD